MNHNLVSARLLVLSALWTVIAVGCGDDTIQQQNRAPTVVLDAPQEGDQFKPGPITVQLTATDPDAFDPAESLTVSLKWGTAQGTADQDLLCEGGTTSPSSSGLFICTSLQTFEPGDYKLAVRATDGQGVNSETTTVRFSVNNDAPSCTFKTPASGSTTNFDEDVPSLLILECEDADGEVSRAQVCVNSNLNGILGCKSPDSSGALTLQIKFTVPGVQVVTATITDEDAATGTDSFTAQVRACEDEDGDDYSVCESISPEPDCDDDEPLAFPGNTEVCDGFDNDCDGEADNIVDIDGDGFLCDDCDNNVISINPEGLESCNGKDDDCDAKTDETFDADGDTYLSACSVGGKPKDCDDNDSATHPGAVEDCNGKDTDCNGVVDDRDADGDLWVTSDCTGYTGSSGGDCADNNPFFNPGATEICDGKDEDCDGRLDNGTLCFDDDEDGYCEANCTDGGPDGDCDDDFPYTYPGAVERFDHRDNNCDEVEEGREFPIDLAWIILDGYRASSLTGKAVDGGHDVSGDDIDDFIIGAPNFDDTGNGLQRGAAFVVHGRERWPVGVATSLNGFTSSFLYTEGRDQAQAGTAVANVGDMNGDGLSDFAVGAPRSNVIIPGTTLAEAGGAYILFGKTTGWGNTTLASAITRVDGVAAGVQLGTSLSGGDLNGDNLADLIIGAPHPVDSVFAGAGWGFIFPGRFQGFPPTAGPQNVYQLQGDPGQAMGRDVTFIGVHDGDSYGEAAIAGDADSSNRGIVVRIPGDPGYVAGGKAFIAEEESGTWAGEATGEEVGSTLSGNVDIDGNGRKDLLFGRTYQDPSIARAMAYAMLGADGVAQEDGYAEDLVDVAFLPQTGDNCPCTVSGIGDMNGDGVEDFAVAAAFATVNGVDSTGRVYLFYGRLAAVDPWPADVDVAAEADAIFYGTLPQQRIGFTLGRAGDINGDGYDDLIISAPFMTTDPTGSGVTVSQAGRVYVQFGAPGP